eukprot:TRINITY_DN674_c2_g1_i1.p1 TRINITY_DN674_c2_g1~~TRINITY_DN674_c2_g1_i1.p1  ORF type:complete len:602 (-),score=182.69 TRINITY_DN674_c2_g1_i1:54-1859(-)
MSSLGKSYGDDLEDLSKIIDKEQEEKNKVVRSKPKKVVVGFNVGSSDPSPPSSFSGGSTPSSLKENSINVPQKQQNKQPQNKNNANNNNSKADNTNNNANTQKGQNNNAQKQNNNAQKGGQNNNNNNNNKSESNDKKPEKKDTTNFVKPEKKQLSRAERREIQEAQRAAKAERNQQSSTNNPNPSKSNPSAKSATTSDDNSSGGTPKQSQPRSKPDPNKISSTSAIPNKPLIQFASSANLNPGFKQVGLFSHLPNYQNRNSANLGVSFTASEKIHPAVISLGLKYSSQTITGSNARCVAMLTAFKEVIRSYKTPPEASLHRDLEAHLGPQIAFLKECRPISISMGNAINSLKREIHKTLEMVEEEAKDFLIKKIDKFIEVRIVLADKAIASNACDKINEGDVILTFGLSHSVEMMLKQAKYEGKQYRVVIVDSWPRREGRELLSRLKKEGVECTYVLMNGLSYAMKGVSKVFLGASSLLANGYVISRAGTAMVASMADAYNIPVIVCCEAYKFCERVRLDSICYNELGDPEKLIHDEEGEIGAVEMAKEMRQAWENPVTRLKLLNLEYDVTPMKFISMVITEFGLIPPTSVPVVIREYHNE